MKKKNSINEDTDVIDGIYDNFQNFNNYKSRNNYINLTNLENNSSNNNPLIDNPSPKNSQWKKNPFRIKYDKILKKKEEMLLNKNIFRSDIYEYNNDNVRESSNINFLGNDSNRLYVIESLQSDTNVNLINYINNSNRNQVDISKDEVDEYLREYEKEEKSKKKLKTFANQTRRVYVNTIKNILNTFGEIRGENNYLRSFQTQFKRTNIREHEKFKENNFFFKFKSRDLVYEDKKIEKFLEEKQREEEESNRYFVLDKKAKFLNSVRDIMKKDVMKRIKFKNQKMVQFDYFIIYV